MNIDMTPTWTGVLPYLMVGMTDGNDQGRKIARDELAKMAKAADLYTETRAALIRVSDIIDEAPQSDISTALRTKLCAAVAK